MGSSPSPDIFSIYLNEELNQMENKNKNNKNASNSLVFGRWPQTKTSITFLSNGSPGHDLFHISSYEVKPQVLQLLLELNST